MSDELTEYLLQDRHHAKISPEMLEMMGKQAANRLIEEDIALNESIAKLAGGYPDVNPEQVKRICEFANTAVYLAKHDQAKTAGADSSYPQFDLAEPGRIIQDLTDGARPTVVSSVDAAYGCLPAQKEKLSAVTSNALLAEMFGMGEHEQSLDYSKETAVGDILDTKSDLKALRDSLVHTGERFNLYAKEASAAYYEEVKRHLLDGGSFTDVVRAAHEVVGSEKVAAVLNPFVSDLIRERVATPTQLASQVGGLEKVASRRVNQEHPFVSLLGAAVSHKTEFDKIAVALDEVDAELVRVNKFIKENLGAKSAR